MPDLVGTSVPRREDERVLRGRAEYLDDLHLDGMLHVAFVRSPFPRARIGAIAKPDGAFVLTGADLGPEVEELPTQGLPGVELADAAHPVRARDDVRYAGQPVAAVVAASRAAAEDAAELVEVEWEPLDAVVDPRTAPEWVYRYAASEGDVEDAFAGAAHVVARSFSIPRIVTAPMETRGALAAPGPDGLTVWLSAQSRDRQRDQLRHALGREDIEVVVPDVGGAFGSKGVIAPEYAATALCAAMLGVPVKWTEDRLENFLAAYQGRGLEADAELALDADGRFLAVRARLFADVGAYLFATTPTPGHTTANLLCGCYAIPACAVDLYGARTTKVPVGPSRGAGRPEAALLVEAMVDEAARELGIDAVELRRRNFVREFPHRTPLGYTYDSGDFEQCLDRALELVRPERSRDGRRLVGTGVGCYVERAGGMWETASAERADGGRVVVTVGSSPHGQGHATTFAQIAADELGVPIEQVELRFEGAGIGTFASRSTAMGGSAVALACRKLRDEGGDSATVRFESDQVFSSGCYAAVVEVERATGRLTVLRIAAVDDCGTVINPLLAEGQVYGGTAYGLGECLIEEAEWDEWGNPLSNSFAAYHLLTAAEMPPVEAAFVETPSPLNPLGAKGIGEGGAIGVLPAVANAVADALGRRLDPPFTAQKLWEALR
ncbi:MAG TPA: xanthine dehydrogenase family protein molybdopterin-binding subunit [Gaiellaceae bacterium]